MKRAAGFDMTSIEFEKILQDFIDIPGGLYNCLKYYLSSEGQNLLKKAVDEVKSFNLRKVFFVGHSYNYFASIVPFYYLNSLFRKSHAETSQHIECISFEMDEFLNYFKPKRQLDESLFCFISQSGDSIQLKQSIKGLLDHKIEKKYIWGVSNTQDSFLHEHSGICFENKTGSEEMYGIKSYSNTILILYFIARAISGEKPITSKIETDIRNLIFEVKFYGTDWDSHTKSITQFLGEDYEFLYFISKGTSLSTAHQAAQSCKAYARTFGAGMELGLFMRGPFQIVDDNFRCVIIVSDEVAMEDILEAIDLITNKMGSGKVVLINNSRNLSSLGRSNPNVWVFEHANKNQYLAPIFEISMLQFVFLQRSKQIGIVD